MGRSSVGHRSYAERPISPGVNTRPGDVRTPAAPRCQFRPRPLIPPRTFALRRPISAREDTTIQAVEGQPDRNPSRPRRLLWTAHSRTYASVSGTNGIEKNPRAMGSTVRPRRRGPGRPHPSAKERCRNNFPGSSSAACGFADRVRRFADGARTGPPDLRSRKRQDGSREVILAAFLRDVWSRARPAAPGRTAGRCGRRRRRRPARTRRPARWRCRAGPSSGRRH